MSAAIALMALVASYLVLRLLVRVAPRLGLLDAPGGAEGARKLQRAPTALVGGLAIALASALALWAEWRFDSRPLLDPRMPWKLALPPLEWRLGAAALALAVGLIDDRVERGLAAGPKLALQCLPGLALAWPSAAAGDFGAAALWLCGALLAQNAINTFDNADLAAPLVCLLGLAGPLPGVAAAIAGFLPFHVPGPREQKLGLPQAYLGDSGAHLLGLLICCSPAAWGALVLPVLDLARVCAQRIAAGDKPWIGDRRHLAHRLQARGLGTLSVGLVLAAIALPAIAGTVAQARFELPWAAAAGAGATLALFALAVLATRARAADASGA